MNKILSHIIDYYCRGKTWWLYVPLFAYYSYILYRHITDPLYSSLIGYFSITIHELGHPMFSFDGQLLQSAGGTITEFAVPLLLCIYFIRRLDLVGFTFPLSMIVMSLFHTATYIDDADCICLSYISMGPTTEDITNHDWYVILTTFNLLEFDEILALLLRMTGMVLMLVNIGFGIYLMVRMARLQKT
ncbi:hypothetical protein HY469_04515 [Candidatus Roizmanbacteria bacterium]|nr:hypothetical protein [Candidatus Roizmanbacteria bacterium]